MAAIVQVGFNFSGRGEPKRIPGAYVSRDYFQLFATETNLGHLFQASDQREGAAPVCIISEKFWRQELGSDRGIFTQSINLDGFPYTIIGVLSPDAPDFRSNPKTDVWIPLEAKPPWKAQQVNYLNVIGQLRPGSTPDQARSDLRAVQNQIDAQFPNDKHDIIMSSLSETMLGSARQGLMMLLIAVGFVLVIACANVANMVLARATRRMREVAVREALGANRVRLIRQLLTENLILTMLAAIGAVLMAYALGGLLLRFWPGTIRRPDVIAIDWQVLVFTAAIAFLSTLFFGLAPAFRLSRLDINRTLRDAPGLQNTGGPAGNRLRNIFVVSEISFATVLLTLAIISLRSFGQLLQINPGFQPDKVVTMRVPLTPKNYPKPEQQLQFYDNLARQLQALPGIESSGLTSFLPLASGRTGVFDVKGRVFEPSARPWAEKHYVSPGYFETMKIPLIKGDLFTTSDRGNTVKSVVINQTTAQHLWPGEDPLGKLIKAEPDKDDFQQIIAVVGDVKGNSLESTSPMQLYLDSFQYPVSDMTIVARTSLSSGSAIASIKGAVLSIDASQPISNIATMDEIIDNSISGARSSTFLLGLFASVAMALAVLGIYGVMAYSVTQRNHEFGIRIAMGAQPRSIMAMVLKTGVLLVAIGTALGLIGSLVITHLLRSQLVGVSPADMPTYIMVPSLLLVSALLASYLPAYRATKANPMAMLRHD
jgi:putative ABC transport system permease protein